MPLPPGVSQQQFDEARRRFGRVVGDEWVLTSAADIATYRDGSTPFLGDEAEEYIPSGAVAPDSVEEVQEIVRIANEFLVPLWPISTGRNLLYGGAAPRLTGTMVLDLKRMDRVLEVNETLAYAVVEPGVTYLDFYRYLREHKLKFSIVDCPGPGLGSLIGNALDHGVGNTTHHDHFDNHCGMEVVLPDGELLRTGAGAIPNSRAWHTFKYGFGPHISPIFGQSNFGIVVKMGFWLLPEQQAARIYRIQVPLYENVTPLLEVLEHLTCSRIIDGSWQLQPSILRSNDPEIRAAIERNASQDELGRLGAQKGIAYWDTRVNFYGPPGVIDAKVAYVREQFARIAGSTIVLSGDYRFPLDPATVANEDGFVHQSLGIPTNALLHRSPGNPGSAGFSPIIPATGPALMKALRVLADAYREFGLPAPMPAIWNYYPRNLVLLMGMRITTDPEANRVNRERFERLARIVAANGWGVYRAAPAFHDAIVGAQSFNNGALLRFQETVKDAIDPNGILAPGRNGIWPKRLRRA